jgi:histidinol dehydrogenase
MMQPYLNPNSSEWRSLTKRPTATYKSLEPLVTSVFDSVKKQGDKSIIDYTAQFDGIRQDNFKVKTDEFEKASAAVPEVLKKAIQNAKPTSLVFTKHNYQIP